MSNEPHPPSQERDVACAELKSDHDGPFGEQSMARNPQRQQTIRDFYNAIDVTREIDFESGDCVREGALPKDVYVENLHRDGLWLPRRALFNAIRNNASAARYFFTGMRGSGKSTELRRLRRELEDVGLVVFYSDMTEYLPLNSPIEISDFLLVLVSALANCVHDDPRFGKDLSRQNFLERLVQFLSTEVKLEGIQWDIDTIIQKFGFQFKFRQNPHFRAQLQTKLRGLIDRLVGVSRDFVDGLVTYLGSQTIANTSVVFIVDSVERIQGVGEEAKAVFDSIEYLFGSHCDKLEFARLSVIYTVPQYISAVTQVGDGNPVYSLPAPHVFEKPEPGKHGADHREGMNRVIEVITRRLPGWQSFFSEHQLRQLVRHTGGDLRDLFLLVREVLNLVDPDDDAHFPIPDEAIRQTEKVRRNLFGVIPASDMEWLNRVVATHGHGLLSESDLRTFARLLDSKLIFQYRNGDNWYDVHPLLWEQVKLWSKEKARAGTVP